MDYQCCHCDKIFARKSTLERHILTCKFAKEGPNKYTKIIEEQDKTIKRLRTERKKWKEEKTKLREKVKRLEGIVEGMNMSSNNPHSTISTNNGAVNTKNKGVINQNKVTINYHLRDLSITHIHPFTEEVIEPLVAQSYTYPMIKKDFQGLLEGFLAVASNTKGGIYECNYISKDPSRLTFQRLGEERVWCRDPKGLFIEKFYVMAKAVWKDHHREFKRRLNALQDRAARYPADDRLQNKEHAKSAMLSKIADGYVYKAIMYGDEHEKTLIKMLCSAVQKENSLEHICALQSKQTHPRKDPKYQDSRSSEKSPSSSSYEYSYPELSEEVPDV